jgi:ATP-dependent helicase/nuclease subunit B
LNPESIASADEPSAATLIVEGRLAAQQWEIHLAEPMLARGTAAWTSAAVLTYRAWTESLWAARRDWSSAHLLRPRQSEALWREVIADSREGAALIGSRGVAAWARDARERLAAWRLDPHAAVSSAMEGGDFAAFLRWQARYIERLREGGWVDAAGLETALARQSFPSSGLLDLAEPFEATPARRTLFDALRRAGWRIGPRPVPAASGRAVRLRLADARAELEAAARWARRRLERAPERRLAVVVPGLAERRSEVRRVFAAEGLLGRAHFEAGEPAHAGPLIGAALNALELLSPAGSFAELSRWLRGAAFFGADGAESAAAARLEAQLRTELLAQLPFERAYAAGGLRERLQNRVPRLATRLDAAVQRLGSDPSPRAPSHWARLWQGILQQLGWTAGAVMEADEARAWESALTELARLTPIVGRISASRARAELASVLARDGRRRRLPYSGVHVLESIANVGPGYAAAWLAGMTDGVMPRPVALNPLLPRALQVGAGMPWASPADALARSRAQLDAVLGRVPEAMLSWPAFEHENPAEPSPLIRALPDARLEEVGGETTRRARPRRRRETVADPPPPAPPGPVRGGTRALNAAALCPLRAFCEFRLGAKPLEPWDRGLPARLKGIALHRALELLYRRYPSRAALAGASAKALRDAVSACARAALDETFGTARRPLRALHDLEARRVEAAIGAFLDRELERAAFTVAALERRQTVLVGDWTIATRVDRIDELDDGTWAIIDYKSGRAARPADWFRSRMRDVQLPVYAVGSTAPLSALVIAALNARGSAYSGYWQRPDDFPGRSARLPDERRLGEQVDAWRRGLAGLLAEYAAGDTRIFVAELDAARGALAPLTRVYEQFALHRGWLEPWPEA